VVEIINFYDIMEERHAERMGETKENIQILFRNLSENDPLEKSWIFHLFT
jgi:hypothetical protein